MDPMDSMRAGPTHVPKDFNAEDAQNMEDVRTNSNSTTSPNH
jgi:hypothetical protein